MILRMTLAWLLVACLLGTARAQENGTAHLQELRAAATIAYAQSDWADFLKHQRQILDLQPHDPTVVYNTACGFALNGIEDSALALLKILADGGIDLGAANDPDFASLHHRREFQAILKIYDSLFTPVRNAEIVHDLDPPDLVAEGTAYDPVGQRLFIGSMRHGKIYEIGPNNSLIEFAAIDGQGPLGVLGLEVDTIRNLLWAVGTAYLTHENYDDAYLGTTGVFGFDLTSGRRSISFMFPGRFPGFGYNDLTISSEGDIYCSGGPAYVIPAGKSTPELVIPDTLLGISNGICLSGDQRTLFVAGAAIMAVDRTTGEYRTLEHAPDIRVGNIDGMYYYHGSLVGIQHGPAPWRAARWFLNEDETAIDSVHTLERRTDGVLNATTGAIVGDDLYILARALPPSTIPGGIPDGLRLFLGRPVILRLSLADSPSNRADNR